MFQLTLLSEMKRVAPLKEKKWSVWSTMLAAAATLVVRYGNSALVTGSGRTDCKHTHSVSQSVRSDGREEVYQGFLNRSSIWLPSRWRRISVYTNGMQKTLMKIVEEKTKLIKLKGDIQRSQLSLLKKHIFTLLYSVYSRQPVMVSNLIGVCKYISGLLCRFRLSNK